MARLHPALGVAVNAARRVSRQAARRLSVAALALLAPALFLVGCGSSGSHGGAKHGAATRAGGHGPVQVLYAASLEELMNASVGPAFHKATGYTLEGFPGGSKELVSEIKGNVRRADVFISAAPSLNSTLEGKANGNRVSWYAPFASTTLVLGYNPHSRFARQLKSKPWYQVITEPGFRLGFTDPKLDPKGALTVAALRKAASLYHDPALARLASQTSDVFPEEDLVGRLQSGQLDAGFFYTVEASAAKIPIVSLAPVSEQATYTITVLNNAPDEAGAIAFVKFLLSSQGQALMRAVGLSVATTPTAVGGGLPSALRAVIRTGS
jgi:molybdate/tungstate transport system substrate-binding protein